MARYFHRKTALSALSELNVTPLIDLAFCLLIIFMITTPLLEQSIPIKLPIQTTKDMHTAVQKKTQTVSIHKDGALAWGKQHVTLKELTQYLAVCAKEEVPPVIHLRADATLPYQKVIDVVNLIKDNHLSRISLDTQVQ